MNRHKTFYDDGYFSKARHGKFIMKNLMFKKQFGLLLTIVCIVLCYGCPSSPTLPIDYEYTYFHPDNYVWVQAADINENGEIVGSHIIYCKYGLCQDYSTGFIYSGGNSRLD